MFYLKTITKVLLPLLLTLSTLLLILLSSVNPIKKEPKSISPTIAPSQTSSDRPFGCQSATVQHTVNEVRTSASNCTGIRMKRRTLDPLQEMALDDCLELLDEIVADLKSALSGLSPKNSPSRHYNDLGTLLSPAMTNQYTCVDGFTHSKGNVRE
uniref:Pectinesterase inhibitor domain-containing protein n=1 Tax=Nelumbo nucifera TaxID=4432 RepID=A0A822ZZK2_NELNU|nr:TPA_asm: hypothetical protein HUJ06_018193 [Nelumbo nucifera]